MVEPRAIMAYPEGSADASRPACRKDRFAGHRHCRMSVNAPDFSGIRHLSGRRSVCTAGMGQSIRSGRPRSSKAFIGTGTAAACRSRLACLPV